MNGKLLVVRTQPIATQNQQLMIKVENLALDVKQKIIQEIQQGQLEISKYRQNINQIIKQSSLKNRSNSVPHFTYSISQFSTEDQQRVKQMIRAQKYYHQNLEKAAVNLQQKIRQEQQISKQKAIQQKKRMFQEKKMKVLDSIQLIKQRQQQRKKQNSQENMNLNAVKSQKKLHEILAEKWKKEEQKSIIQRNSALQKIKQQKKLNLQQIKQHAIKHDESLNKFRQSRIMQSRLSQPETKKYYNSVFLSRIVEEEEKAKDEFNAKKKMAKQFAQKISEYSQIVRQNYKPKIMQSRIEASKSQVKESKSLSHLQTVHKGNDYMKEVNEKLAQHKTFSQKLPQTNKSQYFKYRNYLTQMRVKKSEQQKQKLINEKVLRSDQYQRQVKKIMSSSELSQQEKFMRAKLVTKKIESKVGKKNPFKLIDTINAKIQILRHVSG